MQSSKIVIKNDLALKTKVLAKNQTECIYFYIIGNLRNNESEKKSILCEYYTYRNYKK